MSTIMTSPPQSLGESGKQIQRAIGLLSLAIDPECEPPLLADLYEPCLQRAKEKPAIFLSEIASFVGAIMAAIPRERLQQCLDSISDTAETMEDNPPIQESMRTIVPWVWAEVTLADAFESEVAA